jgi:RNA 3'-phosphate cyclase
VLEIDGSQKSGSGTILRLSVALASILNQPLHIYKIRQKRPQPGLRPQHLEAVLTAARLTNAEVRGASLGSRELWFTPQEITGGDIRAEIGTAGSISMLLLTILPLCILAKTTVNLHVIKGGTDVRNAPTINYIKNVLLETLAHMGLKSSLTVHKYGYFPRGMGEIMLEVEARQKLRPLRLEERGEIEELRGVSVCTYLANRKVAERQAKAANDLLKSSGLDAKIEIINDMSNPIQKGSSLVLWAKSSRCALLGGDAVGELGKPSELVGQEAARNLLVEIQSGTTVDVHLADILVPYVALVDGESVYLSRSMTDHLKTNVELTQDIMGVKFGITKIGDLYRIKAKKS